MLKDIFIDKTYKSCLLRETTIVKQLCSTILECLKQTPITPIYRRKQRSPDIKLITTEY